MDALARAVELCDEHDLHVVVVTLRGDVPDDLRPRLLAEASAEVRGLLDAEERPVWWVEADGDATLFVVDALAMDLKEKLVALEDDHPLGPWFNLDLVTEMPDGTRTVWHGSAWRTTERPQPSGDLLRESVDDYDWNE